MSQIRKKAEEIVSPLQKYVRPGVNLHRLEEIKVLFDLFDKEKTGLVNPKDIKSALQSTGKQMKGHPLFQLICDIDQEGGGCIDFESFIFFVTPKIIGSQTEEQMRRLFGLFDDEKIGFITIAGLRRACKYLHVDLQETDFEQMMKQADGDGDGFVTFEEFNAIINYRPNS